MNSPIGLFTLTPQYTICTNRIKIFCVKSFSNMLKCVGVVTSLQGQRGIGKVTTTTVN